MDEERLKFLREKMGDDQLEAGMAYHAKVAALLFKELLDAGLPVDVAIRMVADWQRLLLCKGLWPDTPPHI